jgi:hypothetical protein
MPVCSFRFMKRLLPLLAVCVAVLASGCGSRRATITGEVKYNGAPLPAGTITFLVQAGEKQVVAAEIVDGKYTVKGIDVGQAKVAVMTLPPAKGGLPPRGGKAVEAPSTFSSSPAGKYVPIPLKYANPDQSGLTYEIKPGSQTKDFDLSR